MKRLFIIIIILLLLVGCKNSNNYLSNEIIKKIDDKPNQSNIYNISMKEFTNFKWDKMVIFEFGSSNVEVSNALGVEYEDSTDLMSGMVFVYKKKIVYKEEAPYNPDLLTNFNYRVENEPGEPNCMVFTPNNAIFMVDRVNIDGKFYYTIVPFKNLNRYKEENLGD